MATVSVVIPTLNEEKHISKCIESILNSTYEDLEILVVDGGSKDRTVEIVSKYEKVKILKNPFRYTPDGLNIGIQNSKGKYIFLAGAHSSFDEKYIEECVKRLEEGECDVAGGVLKTLPRNDTAKAKAIANTLQNIFGFGASKFRIAKNECQDQYVDTVAYGIYKKEIFENVGLFNTMLIRNQDIDMNYRIKRAGYKVMLVPSVKAYYYAQDNFRDFFKNNYQNGFWVILSTRYTKRAFSQRHLTPMFFVLYLLTIPFSVFLPSFLRINWISPLLLYILLNLYFSAKSNRDFKTFVLTMFSFFVLHISYGLGSLLAIPKLFSKSCPACQMRGGVLND